MSIYLHSLTLVKCSRFTLRNEVVDHFISKPPTTTTLEASPLFTPSFTSQGPVMQPRHIRKSKQGISGSFDTIFGREQSEITSLGYRKLMKIATILLMVQKSCVHQLRLLVYPIIHISHVVWDFWTINRMNTQKKVGLFGFRDPNAWIPKA